jgi:tetratricopeptide (TPR) repeat protein
LDAQSGTHLWAEKYDGTIEDVFDLQDRITDRVVGIVEPNVQRSEIERSRRKRPENLDAYDLYLRALPHVAAHMPKDVRVALPLLRQALEFDPEYAAAHALIAWCHELCFTRAGFAEADRSAALSHARVAIASNTDDAATLAIAGFVMSMLVKHGSGDHQAALSAIRRALSHNPSCATALYLGAQASAIAGRLDDAKAFAQRALLLSPFDPLVFEAQMALGETALQEERYDDAAAFFAEAAHANIDFSTAYFFEAIALALLGRMSEAQALADRATKLEPGVSARLFSEHGGINQMLLRQLLSGAKLLRL